MHEIGIVRSMCKTVLDYAKANNVQRISEIVCEVGELSLVIPEYVEELYPAVGTLCKTSGMLVERSIRSAVDSAWRRRDERVWRKFFRPDSTGTIVRPSNTVFINAVAKAYHEKIR